MGSRYCSTIDSLYFTLNDIEKYSGFYLTLTKCETLLQFKSMFVVCRKSLYPSSHSLNLQYSFFLSCDRTNIATGIKLDN